MIVLETSPVPATVTPIPHERFQFRFVSPLPIPLPPYKGATFRGLFGHALRRLTCPDRQAVCETCRQSENCLYLRLFETPARGKTYRTGPNRDPHPFLLLPPLQRDHVLSAHHPFVCEIVLIGPWVTALPYLAHAARMMGELGLGHTRLPFRLEGVDRRVGESWHPLYVLEQSRLLPVFDQQPATRAQDAPLFRPLPALVKLRTITPMRLMQGGKEARRFTFPLFMRALLFRLDDLSRLYGAGPLAVDIPALLQQAETITVLQAAMAWSDFARFSSRQGESRLGGLEGEAVLQGDLTPFFPWLLLGQNLHVGKATSFGFGKYALFPAAPQVE